MLVHVFLYATSRNAEDKALCSPLLVLIKIESKDLGRCVAKRIHYKDSIKKLVIF